MCVFVLACVSPLSAFAAEMTEEAAKEFRAAGGGKSSRAHAQAQAAKEEADRVAAIRAAQRAEARAKMVQAGEAPARVEKATDPAVAVELGAVRGGKSSRAHAQAKAAKAAADLAAASEE